MITRTAEQVLADHRARAEHLRQQAEFIASCKPCPFCGGTDLGITDWWDDDGEYDAVACAHCKAEAPATTWNLRADEEKTT